MMITKKGDRISIEEIDTSKLSTNKLLYFFSEIFFVSKFNRFIYVVKNEVNLVGSTKLKGEWSAIFTYSSLCKDPDLKPFDSTFDHYYQVHHNIFLNIYVLFKVIFSRIILLVR